jgi:uncharacterized protein (TIGR02186 family)
MSGPRSRAGRRLAAALLCVLAGAAASGAARAESVVLSISQSEVLITSSFAGADLAIFGVAEAKGAGTPPPDVVITVRGPTQTFLTWRKSQVIGLWMNTDSRAFLDVPGFLSVMSSRPAPTFAAPEVLRAEQIGLDRFLLVQRVGPDFADVVASDPFRTAFLRIQAAHALYQEDPGGVVLLAPNVFQAQLRLPGHAPIGRYEVHVKVLRDGRVTGEARTHFEVARSGFEQSIASFAHANGILYGISVALGSLIVGFLANLLFRKE